LGGANKVGKGLEEHIKSKEKNSRMRKGKVTGEKVLCQ